MIKQTLHCDRCEKKIPPTNGVVNSIKLIEQEVQWDGDNCNDVGDPVYVIVCNVCHSSYEMWRMRTRKRAFPSNSPLPPEALEAAHLEPVAIVVPDALDPYSAETYLVSGTPFSLT